MIAMMRILVLSTLALACLACKKRAAEPDGFVRKSILDIRT